MSSFSFFRKTLKVFIVWKNHLLTYTALFLYSSSPTEVKHRTPQYLFWGGGWRPLRSLFLQMKCKGAPSFVLVTNPLLKLVTYTLYRRTTKIMFHIYSLVYGASDYIYTRQSENTTASSSWSVHKKKTPHR